MEKWDKLLDIKFYKNDVGRGIISPNLNECLKKCNGKWIKILFQDDFLFDKESLNITHNFIVNNEVKNWILSRFIHSYDGINFFREFYPQYNDLIWIGNNTIGCPSVLLIKNDNIELFDDKLEWLMDVEYYKRLYDIHGQPSIINSITVVNRAQNGGISSKISEDIKNKEEKELRLIYG